MKKRRECRPEQDELRENLLRPSRNLGYDRDRLGVHLLNREAYEAAETLFRRAVWLNPFEPLFKQHLAWCLCRMKRRGEAINWIEKALEQDPGSTNARQIKAMIEESPSESASDETRGPHR